MSHWTEFKILLDPATLDKLPKTIVDRYDRTWDVDPQGGGCLKGYYNDVVEAIRRVLPNAQILYRHEGDGEWELINPGRAVPQSTICGNLEAEVYTLKAQLQTLKSAIRIVQGV